jgi:excinuclease UvrABC helicase subunit UvrB
VAYAKRSHEDLIGASHQSLSQLRPVVFFPTDNWESMSAMEVDALVNAFKAPMLPEFTSQAELDSFIAKRETEMREAAKRFEFEKAAKLRNSIKELKEKEFLLG